MFKKNIIPINIPYFEVHDNTNYTRDHCFYRHKTSNDNRKKDIKNLERTYMFLKNNLS